MNEDYLRIRYRSIRGQIKALDDQRAQLIAEHNWIAQQLGQAPWVTRDSILTEGGTAHGTRTTGASQTRK